MDIVQPHQKIWKPTKTESIDSKSPTPVSTLNIKDIYWIAGLLEGEGCFSCQRSGDQPRIVLSMRDSDVVNKYAILTKAKLHSHVNSCCNSMRNAIIYGNLAIQWMMTLYSLMGERRKERILEILNFWKSKSLPVKSHLRLNTTTAMSKRVDTYRKRRKPKTHCPQGHEYTPENSMRNHGSIECRTCNNERARKRYYNL